MSYAQTQDSSSDLPVYLYGSDPVSCPKCGTRTDFVEVGEGRQIHTCLNKTHCGFVFAAEPDEEEIPS